MMAEETDVFYSPGTACPEGWLTPSTRSVTRNLTHHWIPRETAITYCPQQYIGDAYVCDWDSVDVITNSLCQNGRASEQIVTFTRSGGSRPTANFLHLRYQQSDLTPLPIGSLTPRIGNSDKVAGSSAGLTMGAKAAIGVMIPVVMIVVLLAGFCLWRSRQ
jgi:hypothetical protein